MDTAGPSNAGGGSHQPPPPLSTSSSAPTTTTTAGNHFYDFVNICMGKKEKSKSRTKSYFNDVSIPSAAAATATTSSSATATARPSTSTASTSAAIALPTNLSQKQKFIDTYSFPYCDVVDKYERVGKIGQGTFGEVFKAHDRKNNKKVALKKVLMDNEKEGVSANRYALLAYFCCHCTMYEHFLLALRFICFQFPITALREIRILQLLKHENVVNLIEMCRGKGAPADKHRTAFYLVFDFCEHDLAGLLSNHNVKFSLGEIKRVMQQLLNGLYYIHSNKVRFCLVADTHARNHIIRLFVYVLSRTDSAS